MSSSLALQRCWNHGSREAVARCPECERSYCRECVVEHEDRIICSSCLAKLTAAADKPARTWSFRPVLRFAAAFTGIIVAWLLYFSLGRALLAIPDESHARSLWKKTFEEMIEPE
jgi:hypothetical protein